ncbi:MAG: dihydroneopterin aldolase [Bacteroidota bacterium]|nr:dihydroneopterin aldolase [Candidatus Kapabacteria bacterium]MCS7302456.1 dihydroneopterin aldolase [Candidatus Kapabacteria bacterium]MCX7936345.1 dihydroneopterin aldolase [Chlorobiota bacterium]MDW8074374.1 dihydroneopterin aldolase [Bacteroidota bacterium]MDW8271150.1 dihydroneopterin aldolase [Bacteroidota bacterium]
MQHFAKVVIANLHLYSYHGVSSEEQRLGGRYEFDVEFYYDPRPAVEKDDLGLAVNYAEVVECINQVVDSGQRRLLETLAHDLAKAIMERFPPVVKVLIRVRKRSVPVGMVVDYVEVEWCSERTKHQPPF